jgi:hypothetical protein
MTKTLASLTAGMIALLIASSAALAVGTASRTFVSGTGSDTGTCPLTTPCRTFAYALTQTAPSGEIIVLSSAGYGAVTITQAVSIINISNFAGVTVATGNGITINAGVNDSVTLRGLTVDGGGSTASNGIVFNAGGNLIIDQCNVLNFVGDPTAGAGNGILLQPTSGFHNIVITNTLATHNQGEGISYSPSSGTSTSEMVIDHVRTYNNGNGIVLDNTGSGGGLSASISNSISSGNATNGMSLFHMLASLDSSYAVNNISAGVGVFTAAALNLGRSVLADNGIGVLVAGGTVNSYKDNRIAGNGTPVSGVLGTATPM